MRLTAFIALLAVVVGCAFIILVTAMGDLAGHEKERIASLIIPIGLFALALLGAIAA